MQADVYVDQGSPNQDYSVFARVHRLGTTVTNAHINQTHIIPSVTPANANKAIHRFRKYACQTAKS